MTHPYERLTPDLIMEGVRQIRDWSRIERGVGGIRGQYTRGAQYEGVAAQMNLSTEQLDLIKGEHGELPLLQSCVTSTQS